MLAGHGPRAAVWMPAGSCLGWGNRGYGHGMRRIRTVLIDIDGVLTVSWKPLPGTVAALQQLRTQGFPLALVTNTTSRTRASIASTLAEAGFPVTAGDILTDRSSPLPTCASTTRAPGACCSTAATIREDPTGLDLAQGGEPPVDVVLVGGAGPEFSYQALNQALAYQRRPATRHRRVPRRAGTGSSNRS